MTRYGKCTNIEDCPKAKSGEVIVINGTKEFICPSCHEPLFEVSAPKLKRPVWQKAALITAGVLALAGAAAWMLNYPRKPGDPIGDCDSSCVTVEGSSGTDSVYNYEPPEKVVATKGTTIKNSEYCVDCESFYLVADGKGGTEIRTEGYNTRCCKCGSKVAFKDGYYYNIICEDDRIKAVMAEKVE